MSHSYILVGLPGAGKTSVGEMLARELNIPFIDTDCLIVEQSGMPISTIFANYGESYFRDLESSTIKSFDKNSTAVISVGGGAFQCKENRKYLKEIGKVIYLKAKPSVIYSRLRDDSSRPLLQCSSPLEKINELYEIRRENFETADIVIDTDSLEPLSIVKEILRKI